MTWVPEMLETTRTTGLATDEMVSVTLSYPKNYDENTVGFFDLVKYEIYVEQEGQEPGEKMRLNHSSAKELKRILASFGL